MIQRRTQGKASTCANPANSAATVPRVSKASMYPTRGDRSCGRQSLGRARPIANQRSHRCCLQSLAGMLLRHPQTRELSQFIIDQRQQFPRRSPVSLPNSMKNLRHFDHEDQSRSEANTFRFPFSAPVVFKIENAINHRKRRHNEPRSHSRTPVIKSSIGILFSPC